MKYHIHSLVTVLLDLDLNTCAPYIVMGTSNASPYIEKK